MITDWAGLRSLSVSLVVLRYMFSQCNKLGYDLNLDLCPSSNQIFSVLIKNCHKNGQCLIYVFILTVDPCDKALSLIFLPLLSLS